MVLPLDQRVGKHLSYGAIGKRVGLHVDAVLGSANRRQHRFIGRGAIFQQGYFVTHEPAGHC